MVLILSRRTMMRRVIMEVTVTMGRTVLVTLQCVQMDLLNVNLVHLLGVVRRVRWERVEMVRKTVMVLMIFFEH